MRFIAPLSDRVARRIGLGAALLFAFLYLYSVGNIVVAPGVDLAAGGSVPSVSVAPEWSQKMWKQIAPFVWEPIVALYLFRAFAVFISPLNFLLALLLGGLVGLNMAVAFSRARLTYAPRKGGGVVQGFLASLPGLLTGFSCCVPTLVLALSSLAAGFTVATIAVAPYFLPLAAVALVLNLLWSFRQFACSMDR